MNSKRTAMCIALALCLTARAGDLQKANDYLKQALQATDNARRIELLHKSLAEQPSFAGHYQLGKALRDSGQFPGAVQEFRSALDLTGPSEKLDRAHALFQIGATMAQQGNGAEGLTYMQYSLALEKHPAVEQAILRLQSQLAGTIQPAAQLERAFVAASRDLVLDDAAGSAATKVPIWIQFEFDKADLTPQGIAQTIELGRAISSAALGRYRFRVVGHTDLFGAPEYNLALSRRRAQTVTSYLAAQFHISPDRLLPEGHGMDEPLVSKGPREEQAVNRRVEVIEVLPGKF